MADEKSDSDAMDGGTSCFLITSKPPPTPLRCQLLTWVRNFPAKLLKSGRKLIALSLMYYQQHTAAISPNYC